MVDLAGVEFLSVDGLDLLNQARLRSNDRGLDLRVVASGHEVRHALQVAGLDGLCRASLAEALTETGSTEQAGQGGA